MLVNILGNLKHHYTLAMMLVLGLNQKYVVACHLSAYK